MAINRRRSQNYTAPTVLGQRELFLLLIEKGLLDSSKFMSASVRVWPASRRNHNFVVECDSGKSYFIKQGITETTVATISREVAFYESVSKSFPAFKKYIPGFVCFLPEFCVLILDFVRGGLPLNQVPRRRLTPDIFFALGTSMALLHSKTGFGGVRAHRQPAPAILSIGSLSPRELTGMSAAGVEVVRTIQSFPHFENALVSAFEQADDYCLTHNDFKSGNCVIGKSRRPIIVDWEFAAIGDPAWDVGCVFADFLSNWLLSMPLGSQMGTLRLPAVATQPLQTLHPAIQSFWLTYSNGRNLGGERAVSFLLRAIKCAGVKLAQTAYEMCQHTTSLSANELFFLQTSWNVLERPREALVRLFGLSLVDSERGETRLEQIQEA
jgi:hypothetical protein